MIKFGYIFFKGFLILIVFVTVLIVLSSAYIYYNKERLVSSFLSEVKEQVELELSYSSIDLSLVSHFPYATLSVRDLVVKYPTKSNAGNLLNAKRLSFTINTINLIRGNYNIKNCIVEMGVLNYNPRVIDSILSPFLNPEIKTNSRKTNIAVNKFQLKNYELNIFNELNKPSVNIKVINSLLMLNLKNNEVELSFKSELEKLIVDNKRIVDIPIKIQGHIAGNENVYNFKYLGINYKSIDIELTGSYYKNSHLCKLTFASNYFNIKNLMDFMSADIGISNISGKSKFFGEIEYNAKVNVLTLLKINHSSKALIGIKNKNYNIINLEGITTFTNNLKLHNTTIQNLNLTYESINAKLSARIKGLNNPTILAEGEVNIDNPKINFLNKPVHLTAKGSVKVLFSISNLLSSEKATISYHNLKGSLNFGIPKIEGINRIRNLEGIIKLENGVEVESQGYFDNEPFNINLKQNNLIGLIDGCETFAPKVAINAETLDADFFMDLMNELPSNYGNSSKNDRYNVKLESKNLKFFDYIFKDVKSNMAYSNEVFEIKSFSGAGFDGEINGSLKNADNQYYITAEFNNINIKKLFQHYKDFSQTVVTKDNISGDLSGKAFLAFKTDQKGDIDYPSLKLESDLVVDNGKLLGMNKIQKLSKWLKLDQVKSIDFKTLRNRVEINDQCVRIPKMDVMSNVINMQLSGEHYFTGNYSYWMKINFSQVLSRRFLNSSSSADQNNSSDGSINLYLKLAGDVNDYEIKLDKKSSFEKIKNNFDSEGALMKEILKGELNQIIKKDTQMESKLYDSTLIKKSTFRIEWDEYDTLKVENN